LRFFAPLGNPQPCWVKWISTLTSQKEGGGLAAALLPDRSSRPGRPPALNRGVVRARGLVPSGQPPPRKPEESIGNLRAALARPPKPVSAASV
jgi:hypothetical protein